MTAADTAPCGKIQPKSRSKLDGAFHVPCVKMAASNLPDGTNPVVLSSRSSMLELGGIPGSVCLTRHEKQGGLALGLRDGFFLYSALKRETYPNNCPGESNVNHCRVRPSDTGARRQQSQYREIEIYVDCPISAAQAIHVRGYGARHPSADASSVAAHPDRHFPRNRHPGHQPGLDLYRTATPGNGTANHLERRAWTDDAGE